MSEPPPLPSNASLNGAEIWDWAERFSEHVQRQDRISKLRSAIAKIGTCCGDCDKWMKSRQCPREHNVNGRARGPSCYAPTCGQFIEKRQSTKYREDLLRDLAMEESQS